MKRLWVIVGILILIGAAWLDHQNVRVLPGASWYANGTATAATATATHSAATGIRFVITDVVASCDTAVAATLTIQDGTTTIWTGQILGQAVIDWADAPLQASTNANAVATLTTCGVGHVGSVTIKGYAISAG